MLCILVPQPLDRPYTVARYYAHDGPWQTWTRQRFLVNILTSNPMRTARLHPRLDLRGWTFSYARCNVSAEVPISQWARLRRTMSQRHAQLPGNAIEDRPGRLPRCACAGASRDGTVFGRSVVRRGLPTPRRDSPGVCMDEAREIGLEFLFGTWRRFCSVVQRDEDRQFEGP